MTTPEELKKQAREEYQKEKYFATTYPIAFVEKYIDRTTKLALQAALDSLPEEKNYVYTSIKESDRKVYSDEEYTEGHNAAIQQAKKNIKKLL